MIVTELKELEKSKIKVYLDGEAAFILYSSDLKSIALKVDEELSAADYEDIINQTIYPRAIQKALAILKFKDRTEQELQRKLKEADYPEEVIARVIGYMKEYGYLNDERYTSLYVKNRKSTKSKQFIKSELLQKGLDKSVINEVLEAEYKEDSEEDSELFAIKKAIAKKTKTPQLLTFEEKQKLIASLFRKGFNINKIKKILESNREYDLP
ncbi:MAG: RecX family transcriptional regulator [Mobilitalea sp.]